MSDILDIHSRCGSDFGEDGYQGTLLLKENAKTRKGRGFVTASSNSELKTNLSGGAPVLRLEDDKRFEPHRSIEGWVLFVTGIHEEANEDDVKEAFSEYGVIKNLVLNLDRRTGFLKGYALIEYANLEEALDIVENLNGVEFLGEQEKSDTENGF